jgi:hypothetical protein
MIGPRHPLDSVATLVLGLRCSWCPELAPMVARSVGQAGKVSKSERFTKLHAKQTRRSEATVQRDVAKAAAFGDFRRIVQVPGGVSM